MIVISDSARFSTLRFRHPLWSWQKIRNRVLPLRDRGEVINARQTGDSIRAVE
jgi:hypothetical protein